VRYALDAIRRRPGRAVLTSLGIGLAVGLVVILLAVSNGIITSAAELGAESGIDLIGASGTFSGQSLELTPIPKAHYLASQIPRVDPNAVTASPWLVEGLFFANASLYAATNNSTIPTGWGLTNSGAVGWIPSDNYGIQVPDLYGGKGFSESGDPYYAQNYSGTPTHEIVLDQALSSALHVGLNGSIWASVASPPNSASLPSWFASAYQFRVVGISGPFWLVPQELLAFTYLSELQSLMGGAYVSSDEASLLLIHLNDPTSISSDQARIAAAFPWLTLTSMQGILGAIQHVVNLYRTFGDLVGLIGLVVAALFTTTILQMSVDDRSRELALLRAVGHTRASVGLFVVEEAILLGLFGLAIGLPVAYVGAYGLNQLLLRLVSGLPASFSFISFDLGLILIGLAIVVGIGLVAAIAPAARAMQLPVAEELRAP
jgi:hypothetical protein